jgi:hypothetical protein
MARVADAETAESRSGATTTPERTLDARPDTLDFRDLMFVPTLVEVPTYIDVNLFRARQTPILDQGKEGACTGFGLATVANYLLRKREVEPDPVSVSPRMLYEMARRYDEFPGEEYSGSTARGAMKGWHNHGVSSEERWPYRTDDPGVLDHERTVDAIRRPLGAYFRVNHRDLVAMHSAIAEVGILYVTSKVHSGWWRPGAEGRIVPSAQITGAHAFAIVAYEEGGFWIQNSWGVDWGSGGLGFVTYDDWLENGTDVWVARLGAPVILRSREAVASATSPTAGASQAFAFQDLRPHIVSIGNQGRLKPGGTFGTDEKAVDEIFRNDFPRITRNWSTRRLLLYAHGGLVPEKTAVQRVADYRSVLLENQTYPVSFIWHTDLWTTISNIVEDALSRRRPEGFLDAGKDFMLDRLDDALEPLARSLGGLLAWRDMKENAELATSSKDGGARYAAELVAERLRSDPAIQIHMVGHSAGSIFLGPLVQLLTTKGRITRGPLRGRTGFGLKIASCTLWAPACTIDLFKRYYLPAIRSGQIGQFGLFVLTDKSERDDNCNDIYHKSLLYLVSNAF